MQMTVNTYKQILDQTLQNAWTNNYAYKITATCIE